MAVLLLRGKQIDTVENANSCVRNILFGGIKYDAR